MATPRKGPARGSCRPGGASWLRRLHGSAHIREREGLRGSCVALSIPVADRQSFIVRGSLAFVLLMAAACASPTAPDRLSEAASTPPVVAGSSVASAVVALTNAERAHGGMATFGANARLMEAAQIQADQVAVAGRIEHVLQDARYPTLEDRLAASSYAWQAAGENLASGQRSAGQAVDGWMQSAGHRANILNPTFTEIGVGYATDGSGRQYYVQVFGRPRS